MKGKQLPVSEELDFAYLLGLMRPLYNIDEYAWLPELFAILGHEKFIDLCKYAGGEVIKIPSLESLSNSIEALQIFYNKNIKHDVVDVGDEYSDLVAKIESIYNARNDL